MTSQAIFEALPGEAVFAIPLFVFATLVILLVRRIALKRAMQRSNSVVQAYDSLDEDVEAIGRRIETAKSMDDKGALADLYLAEARGHAKLGDEKARIAALTSAAESGSLYGPHGTHASARMELAEIAYAAKDFTSACEHWHLARGAFEASGQTEEQARVEKLMRDNGCPTDWVLTGF